MDQQSPPKKDQMKLYFITFGSLRESHIHL